MNSRPGISFCLDYVSGSGKSRGEIRRMMRVVYGKHVDRSTKAAADRARKKERERQSEPIKDYRKRYVDRGLLPVTDLDSGRFLTLKISHIVRYDFMRVTH